MDVTKPRTTRQDLLPLLLLLGMVAVVHAAAAPPHAFFADDYLFLEQVRGRSLWQALLSPDPIGNFFRPVSRALWFWLLGRASGESPAVFHAANLAVFVSTLALFFEFVRAAAGRAAAFAATAIIGLHTAADVPLAWASGSQDLLAILGALLALRWHVNGRRLFAAGALALALLSKEVVAGTALVALVTDHRADEPWSRTFQRATGLFIVTALWVIAWWFVMHSHGGHPQASRPSLTDAAATLTHLFQTVLALEWRGSGSPWGHWRWLALWPACVAAALAWWTGDEHPAERMAPAPALAWLALATLPVWPVAAIWSAYFYLWALFGVAWAIGSLTMRWPRGARAALVGGLVLLSAQARGLDEFAVGTRAWSWQSHVNLRYVTRSLDTIERYLADLRAQAPALAPRTTIFYANVPPSSGWQAADGPLLRWAYRDTSLRSYYLTDFTRERALRGPVRFFAVEEGALRDRSDTPWLMSFAFSMLIDEQPARAVEALDLQTAPSDTRVSYWRAWAKWGAGDSLGAKADLIRSGMQPVRAVFRDTSVSEVRLIAARDAAALAPWPHARLAARWLDAGDAERATIEAYAYRVLAPTEPDAWRKWAAVQLAQKQYEPALRSLEHFQRLRPATMAPDQEVEQVIVSLRRVLHGDLAHEAQHGHGTDVIREGPHEARPLTDDGR